MAFWQTFRGTAREGFAAETEARSVRHLRQQLANLSIAVAILFAAYPLTDHFRGWVIPLWVASLVGGLLGVGVYLARRVRSSRRMGTAAFALTAISVVGVIVVEKLL